MIFTLKILLLLTPRRQSCLSTSVISTICYSKLILIQEIKERITLFHSGKKSLRKRIYFSVRVDKTLEQRYLMSTQHDYISSTLIYQTDPNAN